MFIEFSNEMINKNYIISMFKRTYYQKDNNNKRLRDENGSFIKDNFLIIIRLDIDRNGNNKDYDDYENAPECFLSEFFDGDQEEEFNERWNELVVLLKE